MQVVQEKRALDCLRMYLLTRIVRGMLRVLDSLMVINERRFRDVGRQVHCGWLGEEEAGRGDERLMGEGGRREAGARLPLCCDRLEGTWIRESENEGFKKSELSISPK